MKQGCRKKFKNNGGITLIALAVTILVLIILASISIKALTGDNGIIGQSKNAKDSAEIDSEKEVIETSVVQATGKDRYGNITKENMKEYMDKNAGEGKTEVIDNGDTLVVKFIDSERYYEVDIDGNTEGPKELINDKNVGDLSKGEKNDGSEEKPFEINCIEDLVTFSIMSNGGNSELGISSSNFSGKYVVLNRTLDFNSIFSYNDYTTTKYGDLNTDGVIEDIRTELTKKDEGCIGFKAINNFAGAFDGKENMLKNIYQKVSDGSVALFVCKSNMIKNISLTGTIINTNWHAAGIICSDGIVSVDNCKNYANVTGYNMVGGICDITRNNNTKISNCINYGTINITGGGWSYCAAGGIIGFVESNATIENCINEGDVIGNTTRAGIIGCSKDVNIKNCINKGKSVAGILGWARGGTINIINSYNFGECNNGIVDGFSGANWEYIMELNIKNCYNLGKVSNSGIIGGQGTVCASITLNIENCYNAGIGNKAILGNISYDGRTTTTTNISNTYYDTSKSTSAGATTDGITALSETEIKNNETFIETLNNNIGENTEWKRWKIGEDGYPTFE